MHPSLNVLLLEGVNDSAVALMRQAGYGAITRLPGALDGAALKAALADAHLVGIRSRTKMTDEMIAASPHLLAIGCFSVGVNQVDIAAARRRGVPVFNAPFSNTRSVAELTIGEIIMLMRGVFARSNAAHAGGWDKSADGAFEVRGKTLGIVGYGNIGSQLAGLAEQMGMRVVFFDLTDKLRRGNVEPTETLEALLAVSDVVSLHVPETPATRGMFGAAQIATMKQGAYLVNNSRGTVVDLEALAASLRGGRLAGAAVDVFPAEPSSNKDRFVSPLQGLPNVILTPHIGGSTVEAQERIGAEVARKLTDYALTGSTFGAVSFPQAQLPPRATGARYAHIHNNVPGVLGRVNAAFASRDLNIAAQYLQTDGDLGYVVVDADGPEEAQAGLLDELRAIPGAIRARVL